MKEIPTKLQKALDVLDESERQLAISRFKHYHEVALKHEFQSPAFWASRMILSGRNDTQINRLIAKRLKQKDS